MEEREQGKEKKGKEGAGASLVAHNSKMKVPAFRVDFS